MKSSAKLTQWAKQIADLVLVDPDNPDGDQLIVCSDLSIDEEGAHTFRVQQDWYGGAVYQVTIKVEEYLPQLVSKYTPPPETPITEDKS